MPGAPKLSPKGAVQINDVYVDDRGLVYAGDRFYRRAVHPGDEHLGGNSHHPSLITHHASDCARGCGLHAAHAQSYPVKPIRIIVPFAPGGGTDVMARLLAQKLTQALGQQVVVDNRGGGGGTIGTELAIRADPDGYTFLLSPPGYAINPSMYPLKFDPLADYTPVVLAAKGPFVVIVHPSLPVKTLRELTAMAKARPGELLSARPGREESRTSRRSCTWTWRR